MVEFGPYLAHHISEFSKLDAINLMYAQSLLHNTFFTVFSAHLVQRFGLSKPLSRKFFLSMSHCIHTAVAPILNSFVIPLLTKLCKVVGISSMKAM